VTFDPALPASKADAIARISTGPVTKVLLRFRCASGHDECRSLSAAMAPSRSTGRRRLGQTVRPCSSPTPRGRVPKRSRRGSGAGD
jgi:hypothetical protein